MEAIVLALTPPTSTAAVSQNDPAIGEGSSSFAPLLTQAISEKDGETDSFISLDSPSDDGSDISSGYPALNLLPLPVNGDPGQIDGLLGAEAATPNAFSAIDILLTTLQADGNIPSDIKGIFAGDKNQAGNNSLFAQHIAALVQAHSAESDVSPAASAVSALTAANPDATEIVPGKSGTSEPMQTIQKGMYSQNQELTLLLSRLQEIISTSDTKGTVNIKQTQTAISLDELTNLTSHVGQTVSGAPEVQTAASASIETAVAGEISSATSRNIVPTDATIHPSSNKTQALRQDIQQQYLDGTINLKEDQAKKDGNGQKGQQDSSNSSQASLSASGFSSLQGDEAVQSTFPSLLTQETGSSQQVAHQGKTVTLPSGTMVTEQQIFNQIIQRFHMTNRMQSSRINLKLHPAELGELKIDLTIKEGSIRANVYAQSQHVQEILEKNMPKLRTVLEQQGFVIEEIVVSSKSETIANFDLFGGQLPNRQSFASPGNEPSTPSTFAAALDSTLNQAAIPESGVNIRA